MGKMKSSVRSNVVYGLLILAPIAVLVLLLVKIVEILEAVAKPLHLHSTASAGAAVLIALVALVIVSFFIGAVIRTQLGSMSFSKVERTVLKQVPGYEILRTVLTGFAEKKAVYPAALVQLYGPGTAVIGFIIEENENGTETVFVPSAPTMAMGTVHLVAKERVTRLKSSSIDVANCVTQWGIGSSKILTT